MYHLTLSVLLILLSQMQPNLAALIGYEVLIDKIKTLDGTRNNKADSFIYTDNWLMYADTVSSDMFEPIFKTLKTLEYINAASSAKEIETVISKFLQHITAKAQLLKNIPHFIEIANESKERFRVFNKFMVAFEDRKTQNSVDKKFLIDSANQLCSSEVFESQSVCLDNFKNVLFELTQSEIKAQEEYLSNNRRMRESGLNISQLQIVAGTKVIERLCEQIRYLIERKNTQIFGKEVQSYSRSLDISDPINYASLQTLDNYISYEGKIIAKIFKASHIAKDVYANNPFGIYVPHDEQLLTLDSFSFGLKDVQARVRYVLDIPVNNILEITEYYAKIYPGCDRNADDIFYGRTEPDILVKLSALIKCGNVRDINFPINTELVDRYQTNFVNIQRRIGQELTNIDRESIVYKDIRKGQALFELTLIYGLRLFNNHHLNHLDGIDEYSHSLAERIKKLIPFRSKTPLAEIFGILTDNVKKMYIELVEILCEVKVVDKDFFSTSQTYLSKCSDYVVAYNSRLETDDNPNVAKSFLAKDLNFLEWIESIISENKLIKADCNSPSNNMKISLISFDMLSALEMGVPIENEENEELNFDHLCPVNIDDIQSMYDTPNILLEISAYEDFPFPASELYYRITEQARALLDAVDPQYEVSDDEFDMIVHDGSSTNTSSPNYSGELLLV